MILKTRIISLGLAAIVMGFICPNAFAQDNAPGQGVPMQLIKPEADTANQFTVPDGTPEEILKWIDQTLEKPPAATDPASLEKFRLDISKALVEATDKIMAGEPTEEQLSDAVRYRILALSVLERLGVEGSVKKIEALLEKLKADGMTELARQTEAFLLQSELQRAMSSGPEAMKAVIAKMTKFVETAEKPGPAELSLAMNVTRIIEAIGTDEEAAQAYETFGKVFAKSEIPQIAKLAATMTGAARRLRLVGKPLELSGEYLDGTKLDWASYRGKVVLVQFWATWCGPCKMEIENILPYYKAYHSKGFEVLGINCDDEREPVDMFLQNKPLPWRNIFSTDPEAAGMENPMAVYYGVLGIPQLILVDKEGKVVSTTCRGPQLGVELAKLLGPIEEDKDTPSDEPPATE